MHSPTTTEDAILIGCFRVTLLSTGRWHVFNVHNAFEHVTYGTEEEIREILTRQSEKWDKRESERLMTCRGWKTTKDAISGKWKDNHFPPKSVPPKRSG